VQYFNKLDADIAEGQNRFVGLTLAILYRVLFSRQRLHDNKYISAAQANINTTVFI